jgi:hypothetical protein
MIMKLCKAEHSTMFEKMMYLLPQGKLKKKTLCFVVHTRSKCAWTIALGCVVLVLKMWSNRTSIDH